MGTKDTRGPRTRSIARRARVIMAMALSRLKKTELARSELLQSRELIETEFAKLASFGLNEPDRWSDWLYARAILYESAALIDQGRELQVGEANSGFVSAFRETKSGPTSADGRRNGSTNDSSPSAGSRGATADDENSLGRMRARAKSEAKGQQWDAAANLYSRAIDSRTTTSIGTLHARSFAASYPNGPRWLLELSSCGPRKRPFGSDVVNMRRCETVGERRSRTMRRSSHRGRWPTKRLNTRDYCCSPATRKSTGATVPRWPTPRRAA